MAKAIENIYGISCSGENTGCDHEANPNIDQCLDCIYVKVREINDRFETIEVGLSGSHYQPDGCDRAFVTGISWDKEYKRPCVHLTYLNRKQDFIPLSELGSSHILGDVTILNTSQSTINKGDSNG